MMKVTINRKSWCVYFWASIWFLMGFAVTGQAQYRFDHWTADNGLPQNSIRSILRTRDGYLWLATFDGLVRFDGVRFTVFNKSNSPGILTNRFVSLYEDKQGDLWAGIETGDALTRRHAGHFSTYTKEDGLPEYVSVHLGGDGQGNLLMSNRNQQFWHWVGDGFQPIGATQFPTPPSKPSNLELTQNIPTWMTEKQLWFYLAGEKHLLTMEQPTDIIGEARQDRQGRVWVGSHDGLRRYEQGQLVPSGLPRGALSNRPSILVYGLQPLHGLTFAADGSLWLTNIESEQSWMVSAHPPDISGLINFGGDLFTTFGDHEGNLWLGTLRNGLFRARPQSLTAHPSIEGHVLGETYSILEDRAGVIWVGTTNGALFRFQNGVPTYCKSCERMPLQYLSSLYEDRTGQLWANGRMRWEEGQFGYGLPKDYDWNSLGEVWAMHEDRSGEYWLGARNGVLRVQGDSMTVLTTKDGLAGNDTKVIIDDGKDGLWLGSYGGLTYYRNGQFQRWTEKDGLPGNTVRALYQDRDGALWIGTYDSGLGRFKDGKFTRYTIREGLFDSGVFQILEDDFGWFWIGCNRGIYRVRKQELLDFAEDKRKVITSVVYGKSDGMVNVECNGGRSPAGLKTRDGKLWFPTMEGVVIIDPATVKANTQPPPVTIEGMKINNELLTGEDSEAALRNHNSALLVRPGQENFEIEYTALSFINSENLRFKYKLEGADADWIEAGTRRTAYFSHLAPGDYVFRVIAANSDGVWNTEGQSLRIKVLPPFYRTWWFLSLTSLSVTGLIVAAFRYRVRQVEQRQAAQQVFAQQLIESQEAERKRIAAELHDGLGQDLLVIKNRALFGLMKPDDVAQTTEQLNDISTTASQAIDEVRQIAANLHPHQLDRLGLTKALTAMVQKVGAAAQLNVKCSIEKVDSDLSPPKAINLYRIVQEGLNNIVKHANATEAEIQLSRLPRSLRLTITDNGRGFVPGTTRSQTLGKGGFGLTSLSERALLLGGTLDIESMLGRGTRLTLTMPLPESPQAV